MLTEANVTFTLVAIRQHLQSILAGDMKQQTDARHLMCYISKLGWLQLLWTHQSILLKSKVIFLEAVEK